jgi:hypothetical protein
MFRSSLALLSLLCACSPPDGRGAPPIHPPDAAVGPDFATPANAPTDASTTPTVTFSSSCHGAATVLTGTVTAPNGIDPIANAQVYVPLTTGTFPPTVACELCDQPVDNPSAATTTGADGKFSLDIGALAPGSMVAFTVSKGRFRRASTVPVTACAANPIGAPATVLPGKTAAGSDIPKIAVATGNKDQLDAVLAAMGLDAKVGFDCYEGRVKSATLPALKTPCGTRGNLTYIEDLLVDETKLESYNLLFLSCAPGKFKSLSAAQQSTIATNLKAWAQKGGRLFVTDNSYDYVAQAFPADLTFLNGDGTIDAANVGVGGTSTAPTTYHGVVNDATLGAWLATVGALPAGGTLSLGGYLNHWSVLQSVPMGTADLVDATDAKAYPSATSTTPGPAMKYPQSIKFDVAGAGGNACGRAIYTSYHTLETTTSSSMATLSPQERILEYLMFEAGSCIAPIS